MIAFHNQHSESLHQSSPKLGSKFLNRRHIEVVTGGVQKYIFSIKRDPRVSRNEVGFSVPLRKWATLSIGQEIKVRPYKEEDYLTAIVLEADYMQKKTLVIIHSV